MPAAGLCRRKHLWKIESIDVRAAKIGWFDRNPAWKGLVCGKKGPIWLLRSTRAAAGGLATILFLNRD
jgi:hypothetical protein